MYPYKFLDSHSTSPFLGSRKSVRQTNLKNVFFWKRRNLKNVNRTWQAKAKNCWAPRGFGYTVNDVQNWPLWETLAQVALVHPPRDIPRDDSSSDSIVAVEQLQGFIKGSDTKRCLSSNVGITIMNHPPVITIDSWYKLLPNGWFIIPTLYLV